MNKSTLEKITNQVKKVFISIMNFTYDFIPNTKKLFKAPYKNLTWPKRILKTGMILFGIFMVIIIGKMLIAVIAMIAMFTAVAIGLNDFGKKYE